MAKQKIVVPDIGGAEGAEVIELLVAVGDQVDVDQGLIVLESDKASMEIPSTVAGVVSQLLVSEGELLAEGAAVAVVETVGEASPDTDAEVNAVHDDSAVATAAQPERAAAAAPVKNDPAMSDPADARVAAEEITVVVPDIGTDEAVELIEVSVQVGDTVAEGDSLVVLESDKASMEVPSPHAGEVLKVLVREASSVSQGDDLLVLRTTLNSAAAAPAAAASAETTVVETLPPAAQTAERNSAAEPILAASKSPASAGVYAGPAVRKLARELGVDLTRVNGSGPRGRLLKEDLHRFVQSALAGKPAVTAPVSGSGIPAIPEVDFSNFGEVEVTERSKMDKLTASNMQRSWLNVPHVTQFDDADITELEAFRGSVKAEAERRGVKLTPMPFLLKACAVALRDHPKMASSLAAGGEQLVYKKYTHIGMAVDTPAGLVVPVIQDVDKKSIWELAEEIVVLATKARDRKLMPRDMQGGCFSISSLGNIGGTGFTPIVNAPEVAILGVSRAALKPVWDGAAFVPRKMLPLSLSYDHRVVNGGDAGRFLTYYAALLGDIRKLLL